MKNIVITFLAISLLGCTNKKSTNINLILDEKQIKNELNDSIGTESIFVKGDTMYYYWKLDTNIYKFDTIINQVSYQMETYCLNDSAVFNETWTEKRNSNPNLIEFSVAHNYATDFKIINSQKTYELKLLKENFRDSLPPDFFRICHMWKNEFSHIEGEQPLFIATFAQPDTDYQYAIIYTISEQGILKIIRVEDESETE